MEITYDELRRIYRLEKNTSKLVEVDEDFYESLKDFIEEQKNEYLESINDFSSTKARDFINLKKVTEEIFAIRERKILNKALVHGRTEDPFDEKISLQEKEFFNELMKIIKKHKYHIEEMFKTKEKREKPANLNNVTIRILTDVPAFIGTDMKEHGPFKEGEKTKVPTKIAKLMIDRKIAKMDE